MKTHRWQVLTALWLHEAERPDAGLTQHEIADYVVKAFPESCRDDIRVRLGELEQRGVVRRVGELTSPPTWMTVPEGRAPGG